MNLEDHRAAFRADLSIPRLVSRQPPTSLDANTGVLHQEPGTRVGMSMSGRLLRYLSYPGGYGDQFPWSRALFELRGECRRAHPQHRAADRPYWRGSLCWSAVQLTVVRGHTPEDMALILLLDSPEPVLSRALRLIEESLDHQRHRAEKRAREDEGLSLVCVCGHSYSRHANHAMGWRCLEACQCPRYSAHIPASEHRAVDGLHQQDCPRCRRSSVA